MKREIVDYMGSGEMQRENVDTGSAAIALDSEQLPVPVACAQ